MKPANFHSHCYYCDGRSHPEDYIKFALARNFRAYGFSSHSPLPFETFWNMPKDDLQDYIGEINRLKEKYCDRIEIYLGMEIDWLNEEYNAAGSFFQSLPLDYRIGSLHFLSHGKELKESGMSAIDGDPQEFIQTVNGHYDGNIRRVTEHFFETSVQMVEKGGFDVVGHADKINMNASLFPDFDRTARWYRSALDNLLSAIAEKGLIMEINTKNFVQKGETFPHLDLLKELYGRRIPVMVNSDCHVPDLVNDGRNEILSVLRGAGFRTVREPVSGVWQDVAID
jgi:histidinol-phosphatase (PHP family)